MQKDDDKYKQIHIILHQYTYIYIHTHIYIHIITFFHNMCIYKPVHLNIFIILSPTLNINKLQSS